MYVQTGKRDRAQDSEVDPENDNVEAAKAAVSVVKVFEEAVAALASLKDHIKQLN